jgi:hypothetical protein
MGTAEFTKPLITSLRTGLSMLVRAAPESGDALEAVFSRQDLDRCVALLSQSFGVPIKTFGQPPALDRELHRVVERLGGIRLEQCLFLKVGEGQEIAYAALWPWASDASRVTLKIGVIRA